jgi:hypothetical protein
MKRRIGCACVNRGCARAQLKLTRDERLRLKRTFNPASGSRRCSYELYVTHTYGAIGSPAIWFRFLPRALIRSVYGMCRQPDREACRYPNLLRSQGGASSSPQRRRINPYADLITALRLLLRRPRRKRRLRSLRRRYGGSVLACWLLLGQAVQRA